MVGKRIEAIKNCLICFSNNIFNHTKMPYPYIFDSEAKAEMLERLNKLTPETQPQWGKMDVAQMLAHVSVAYGIAFDEVPVKTNPVMKLMLKLFLKKIVVGEKPYAKNSRTAPVFMIADERVFEAEKKKLAAYIELAHDLGKEHFDGMENPSFGKLNAQEWSNLFSKHFDHHCKQFGV